MKELRGGFGRVTSTAPLRVRLNGDDPGDPTDPPATAYAGLVPTLNQEVFVVTAEGRRLIVWAG